MDALPEMDVIIEIPAHSSPVKYQFCKDTGALWVERFLTTSMHYPCDYGYIPDTQTTNGDPLDVLVITPIAVNRGCGLRARPIGILVLTDEKGDDQKIIAVPSPKLTHHYDSIKEITDLPALLLQKIVHFFTHYKDLEEGKWVKFEGWLDQQAAWQKIVACSKSPSTIIRKGAVA